MPNFHEWLIYARINESTDTIAKKIKEFFSKIDPWDDRLAYYSLGTEDNNFESTDNGIKLYVGGSAQNSMWLNNGDRIRPYVRIEIELSVNIKPFNDDTESLFSYGFIDVEDVIESVDVEYYHAIYDTYGYAVEDFYTDSGIYRIAFSEIAPHGINEEPDLTYINDLVTELWNNDSAFAEAERKANDLLPDESDDEE